MSTRFPSIGVKERDFPQLNIKKPLTEIKNFMKDRISFFPFLNYCRHRNIDL